ncbi:TniQ family protein [Lysobacter sp. A286]
MTPLVLPYPEQLGTPFAESLHSLVARTAATYCVPLNKCLRLAVLASTDQPVDMGSYKTLREWVGRGALCSRLLDGLEKLSGRVDIRLTTLQCLRIGQSRELISRRVRLCPLCLDPRFGSGYGMLAHQLTHVRHCPLHLCALIDRCVCGTFFGLRQVDFVGPNCVRCKAQLWKQTGIPIQMDSYAAWREQQMWELVEYASDRERLLAPDEWLARFHLGMARLMSFLEPYTSSERRVIREVAKRCRKDLCARPSLNTLLGLAVVQARGVVDLLRAPDAALTPRLLDIGSVKVERDKRRTKSGSALNRAKKMLKDLLALPDEAELPSVTGVLSHGNIRHVNIWRADPLLLERYQRERRRRRARVKSKIKKAAQFQAALLVQERVSKGILPEIRRDGAQLMIATGATKEVAEQAMRSVLLGWSVFIPELELGGDPTRQG